MPHPNKTLRSLRFALRLLLLVAVFTSLLAAPAWAKKKKGKKNDRSAALARIAYYESLIAASKAQADKAAAAKAAAEQKVLRLRAQLDAAQQNYTYGGSLAEQKAIEVASTSAAREAAEQRILAAQESDSLYHRLRQSLETARQAFHDVRTRLLESSAYKARVKPASGLAAAARQAASSPGDVLRSDPEYVKAEREFRAAETVFNQHRSSLFAEDAEWMNATSVARQVLSDLAEDRAQQDATRRKISGLKIAVRSTAGVASDAAAALQASQAALAAAEKALKSEKAKAKKTVPSSNSPGNSYGTGSSSSSNDKKK